MSVETSNRVWKYSQKGGAPLLLLLAMADWADEWGYCYPRLEQMAAKCRQSERNIITLIGELEQVGEVRRVARGKGGRGKFSGSVYQVTVGLSEAEIATTERVSPLAREVLAKLQSGEIGLPVSRKPAVETGEKISPENFSPEKQSTDFSSVSVVCLNELINVSDSTPPSPPAAESNPIISAEERAEALYRLVRPAHLTLPNSEQRAVALKVLSLYLQKCGSPDSAAQALKPYAAEADARGIRQTNLCWLSEWAAVGQIPRLRTKGRTNVRRIDSPEDQTDYEALRKRMENELTPLMGDGERNQP